MKAILRSHSGVTRTITIHPPPPPYISMAVSKSGAEIWNPHDLMTAEWSLFQEAKFQKAMKVEGTDDWLYVQESQPVKYSDVTKMVMDKLRPSIIEQVGKSNVFYDIMKKGQASKPKEYQMDEKLATELVTSHKKAYGYGPEVESDMAALGKQVKPEVGEDAYNYLTRLFNAVTSKQVAAEAALKAKLNNMLLKLEQAKEAEKYQQQLYQQQLYQSYQQPLYQQPYVSHTQPPLYGYVHSASSMIVGEEAEAPKPQSAESVAPEKKKDVPDPVEPKKRLMKRS